MITIEQLKDVKERTAALERYLDIENKRVQVEEEQLRTQAPGFWDDAKKAEAQMRKVKDLQKWIDGYREVKTIWLPKKKWMQHIKRLSLRWRHWN